MPSPSPPMFFDLNLPYTSSNRDARLRSVVTLLELGYSGAAYNLSLRGVLSDRDRCANTIAPFPLSSLLAAAPALAASAAFHRRLLLSSSPDSSFRQFSRVTVSLDTASAASSVASTSPVLRGYDLVAVRPLSQSAFDHVCKFSDAHLISIDFSHKLPFRLKHQSVKLAIKRGIFFEITYSQLLADKRHLLSDAKLLADWTRGKNLIVSSAASTANEVRGPNDVSNLLSFLLRLSKERAKSAISHNCRSLLAKALRKKHFYKETIRIERMPIDQLSLNSFSVGDWINWDPISSGEGDLPSLHEISKVLSSVNQNPHNANIIKTVDFDLLVQEKPFLLSQHAHNLHEIEPVSDDREETEANEIQLDDQHEQRKVCYMNDDDICLDPGGSNQSDGTPHNKIDVLMKRCISENRKDKSAPVSDEMQLDVQGVLLKECDSRVDDVTLVPGGCSQSDGTLHNKVEAPFNVCSFVKDDSAPDEMQIDEQVAPLREYDINNDDVTADLGGSDQPDETLRNYVEAPLKETTFEKDNSAPLSDGYQEQLCTETDCTRCDIEVPVSDNSHGLAFKFVRKLDIPFIQSEYGNDHNCPVEVVGINGTMAAASINNEVTREEMNSSSSNLFDEVYAATKKIDQMKDENANNSDAIVEKKRKKGEEDQERGSKIIKLDDTRETGDSTTSTSSSISLVDAVLHDIGGEEDQEISKSTQEPSFTSSTKGKKKQKGLPLHPPCTMSFQGPFKHMLFRKKFKR